MVVWDGGVGGWVCRVLSHVIVNVSFGQAETKESEKEKHNTHTHTNERHVIVNVSLVHGADIARQQQQQTIER